MEQVIQKTKPSKSRDYDKDPIKVINYSVRFESHIIALIGFIMFLIIATNIYNIFIGNERVTFWFLVTILVWIALFYKIFIDYPKKFKEQPSYFVFKQNIIQYHHIYLQKKENDLELIVNINNIDKISSCIVCELPQSYGRWHHLTSWQLYRKSSIGVHIGKATLFLRYLITYILFILPYKLWRLHHAGESYLLLKKNLFIQFHNRNYLLVNIYSQKELDETLEYFQLHNISINEKTYFIPHLQNQGWFVDKEEIWINEFKNQGEEQ